MCGQAKIVDRTDTPGPFQSQSKTTVCGGAIGLGAVWTYLALYLGQRLVPDAPLPLHANAFLVNLAADMATVFVSLRILRWASRAGSPVRIPFAVTALIALGALLSYLSLKISVWGRFYDLSFPECLNVILAKSPDGLQYQFGPLFWLAHTSFIPLLILLILIMLAWLAKMSLVPPRLFFGLSHKHSNPNKLTSTFFFFLAALCGIGTAIIKVKSG